MSVVFVLAVLCTQNSAALSVALSQGVFAAVPLSLLQLQPLGRLLMFQSCKSLQLNLAQPGRLAKAPGRAQIHSVHRFVR